MARIVVVATDLIFTTKISGTAAALGIECAVVGSPDALAKQLKENAVRLVLVDMSLPPPVAARAIRDTAAHGSRPPILAFYSHAQPALADSARQAGATMLMARSKLSAELPEILRHYGDDHPPGSS